MKRFGEWLAMLRNVILALGVIAIGQALPPLQALESWMTPRRTTLLWATTATAALGWALLMGAALYRVRTGGGSLTRAETEASVKSVKDSRMMPYFWRISRYVTPERSWGAGFSDEVSIGQFKAAWRQALWLKDTRWRGLFLMGLGAMLMTLGGFGAIIVLCPPGLKFLAGIALGYAAVRMVKAFRSS